MNDIEIEKIKNLIPIGSIVRLSGIEKKVMITGYIFDGKSDYLGVLWPIGDYSDEAKLGFNTNDVEKIFFRGYENLELEKLKNILLDTDETDNNKEDVVTNG